MTHNIPPDQEPIPSKTSNPATPNSSREPQIPRSAIPPTPPEQRNINKTSEIAIRSVQREILVKKLEEWVQDTTATGNKVEAKNRILACFDSKSTTLKLENFGLNSLPSDCFTYLTQISYLHLSRNSFAALPDSIKNLSSLNSLYLEKNQLSSLPTFIGNLTSLRNLRLDNNQLSSLPESIGNLSSLKSLHLKDNQLSSLPDSIGNLSSLTNLWVSENKLASLPNSIGNLQKLKTLYLSQNELLSLPESIGDLKSLNDLRLYSNKLSSLPASLGNLSSLTELWLDNNEISSLPESIGNLSSLQTLDLENNKLTSLPDFFERLTSLNHLDLNYNQLSSLPESIGNLTSLKYLDLNYNKLSSLPESIGNLTSLEHLSLFNNQLSSLPDSFGNLTSLKNLELTLNSFTSLPESFGNLTSLITLELSRNPLTTLPKSISSNRSFWESKIRCDSSLSHLWASENLLLSTLNGLFQDQEIDSSDYIEKLNLDDSESEILAHFLNRMMNEWGNQYDSQLRTYIEFAVTNKDFRDFFIEEISSSATNCRDRPLYFLSRFSVMASLYQSEISHNSQESLKGLLGLHFLDIIDAYARDLYAQRGNQEALEALEVSLYFLLKVKEKLHIPTVLQSMDNEDFAERQIPNFENPKEKPSDKTEENIEKHIQEVIGRCLESINTPEKRKEIFQNSLFLRKRFEQTDEYNTEKEPIEETYQNALDLVFDPSNTSFADTSFLNAREEIRNALRETRPSTKPQELRNLKETLENIDEFERKQLIENLSQKRKDIIDSLIKKEIIPDAEQFANMQMPFFGIG